MAGGPGEGGRPGRDRPVRTDAERGDAETAGHALGAWPAVGVDDEVAWEARPGARIPAADRGHRYRPTLPALIAGRPVMLQPASTSAAESAALALRSADERITDAASTVALLRTESAASSKIEQIEVGQRDVGRALAGLPTPQRSAIEVANNVRALQSALSVDLDVITPELLDEVHAELLPDRDWSGTPRTVQNWIGGSDYSPREARHIPPRPEHVPQLLDDLTAFASRDDMPAVVQAAISHAQFETIHPYEDGNGRVGRALAHMVLRRRGITVNGIAPLSIAVLSDTQRYLEGLRSYERGDLPTWADYFSQAATIAAESMTRLSNRLIELRDEWRRLPAVAGSRSDAAIRRAVEQLSTHPVCSSAQLAERLAVSRPAARRALEQLTDVGVLNRTTAARNLQVYEAHEVFAAIDDMERAADH